MIVAACGDTAPVASPIFNGTIGNPFEKTTEPATQRPARVIEVNPYSGYTTSATVGRLVPTTPTPGSSGFFSKTLETSPKPSQTSTIAVNKEATPNPNLRKITPNLDLLFVGNIDPTTKKRQVLHAKVISKSDAFIEIVFAGDVTKYKYEIGKSKVYGDVLWSLGNPNLIPVFDNATEVNVFDDNSPINVISPTVITGSDFQDHIIDVKTVGGAVRNPRKRKGYFPNKKFKNER